jgi:hypothetical protein
MLAAIAAPAARLVAVTALTTRPARDRWCDFVWPQTVFCTLFLLDFVVRIGNDGYAD